MISRRRRLADLNVFGMASKGVAKRLQYSGRPLLDGVEWGASTNSVLLRLEKEELPKAHADFDAASRDFVRTRCGILERIVALAAQPNVSRPARLLEILSSSYNRTRRVL